jgi:hypothetical protein
MPQLRSMLGERCAGDGRCGGAGRDALSMAGVDSWQATAPCGADGSMKAAISCRPQSSSNRGVLDIERSGKGEVRSREGCSAAWWGGCVGGAGGTEAGAGGGGGAASEVSWAHFNGARSSGGPGARRRGCGLQGDGGWSHACPLPSITLRGASTGRQGTPAISSHSVAAPNHAHVEAAGVRLSPGRARSATPLGERRAPPSDEDGAAVVGDSGAASNGGGPGATGCRSVHTDRRAMCRGFCGGARQRRWHVHIFGRGCGRGGEGRPSPPLARVRWQHDAGSGCGTSSSSGSVAICVDVGVRGARVGRWREREQ